MSLRKPNFDDEQTLQSARRVVPLEKIDAKERHRKQWLLGGAFAIAMLLGAASALLASYMKLRNAPSARTEISEVETPDVPVAETTEPAVSQLPAIENIDDLQNAEALVEPVAPKKAPVVKRRPTYSPDSEPIRPPVVREGDEEQELQRIREAVLIDEWQERRARRATRRERRNQVDHHERDLSNLDEIFQGRRKRP